jgi:hypothetical protein
MVLVGLSEDRANRGGDHLGGGLRHAAQHVAHEVHAPVRMTTFPFTSTVRSSSRVQGLTLSGTHRRAGHTCTAAPPRSTSTAATGTCSTKGFADAGAVRHTVAYGSGELPAYWLTATAPRRGVVLSRAVSTCDGVVLGRTGRRDMPGTPTIPRVLEDEGSDPRRRAGGTARIDGSEVRDLQQRSRPLGTRRGLETTGSPDRARRRLAGSPPR